MQPEEEVDMEPEVVVEEEAEEAMEHHRGHLTGCKRWALFCMQSKERWSAVVLIQSMFHILMHQYSKSHLTSIAISRLVCSPVIVSISQPRE